MISFLIPAFNAEKTIERAINSILNQKTSIDYEIIVVNDGSMDNIDEKMQKFSDNNKIKYFKKENTGVADTRNFCVEKASGEYIIFVDSDDYISNTLLQDIESYINKKIDLIKWNPIFVDENQNELTKPKSFYYENSTGEQGFNMLFGKDNLIDCLWNYAIKKEIMLKFPAGTYHEDFAIMPIIVLKAKTMVSIDKYEYYYVQSKNSIMRNCDIEKTKKKIQDRLFHYDNIIKEIDKMNLAKVTKENVKIYLTNSLLVIVPELDKDNKKYFKMELKNRKIAQNIKVRNIKQLIKRILLEIEY